MDALDTGPIVDQEHAGWVACCKYFVHTVLNYELDIIILNKEGLSG